jgi:hypothetical protein
MRRYFIIMSLIIALLAASVFVVSAACNIAGTPAGETIICTGTSTMIDAQGGIDTINVSGNLTGNVVGGADADTITIDGSVTGLVYGDIMGTNLAANDTIIINGSVGAVIGDSNTGTDLAGNDTIIINGVVIGNVITDFTSTSNTIDGGNDTVILQDGANGGPDNALFIYGIIGYNTLSFEFTVNTEAEYLTLSAAIAVADPNGGSLVFNGQTFNWNGFDQLVENLIRNYSTVTPIAPSPFEPARHPIFRDGRINDDDPWASYAIYCPSGVITIYSIDGESNGLLAIEATPEEIAAAGVPTEENVLIDEGLGVQLYRLVTGEFLVVGAPDAEGKVYYVLFSACARAGVIRTYTTP